MSGRHPDGSAGGPGRDFAAAFRRAADWLALAAAPTFAVMALLALVPGGPDPFCGAMPQASPLTGMATMYALMSGFHAAPWLRRVAGAPGRGRAPS